MVSLIGRTVGKYRIVEQLGQGGMAEVYKAYQSNLDRHVALKLMHPHLAETEDFRERFEREAKHVASLQHPNIIQVYDFDVQDGLSYMVMEFVDGATLKTRLEELHAKDRTLPLDEAVSVLKDVAAALAYAHERGMVHRDVKPANVLLDRFGRVFLTDFGIAKILAGPDHTASGLVMGTPAYMSPEQGLGRAGDERSDIYSLGIMLYEMATGSIPYSADTPVAVMIKQINDPLPIPSRLRPELPSAIEAIILKAAAKDPAQRYQTAHELIVDLEAWESAQATRVAGVPRALDAAASPQATVSPQAIAETVAIARPPVPARRGGLAVWLTIAGVVVLILGSGAALAMSRLLPRSGRGDPHPPATSPALASPQPTHPPESTPSLSATSLPTVSPTHPPGPSPQPTQFDGHAASDPGGGAYCTSGAAHADLPPFADPVALDLSAESPGVLRVTLTLSDPGGVSGVPDERAFYGISVMGLPDGAPADELSQTEQVFFNGVRFDASYDFFPGQTPAAALGVWSSEAGNFRPGPVAVQVERPSPSSVTFVVDVGAMAADDPVMAGSVRDGKLALRVFALVQFWKSALTSDSWCKAIGRGPDGSPQLPVVVDIASP